MSHQSPSIETSPAIGLADTTVVIEEGHNYDLKDDKRLPYQHGIILGHGLSAVVQQVHDPGSKEVYAKKTIIFSGKLDKEDKEVFFRNEVDITRVLKGHHHIIRLFATYVAQQEFGLLLQPVADGNNLEQYLSKYLDIAEQLQPLSTTKNVMTRALEQCFGCLANGLAFIHSKGIRHRDIKAPNILMHQHSVIITDFGSSKNTTQLGVNTTEGNVDFHTPRYSAPEVLEEEKRSFDADVWSLGCVFIEILSALTPGFVYDPRTKFAQMMDELHSLLDSAAVLPHLACMKEVIKSMTLHNRVQRYDIGMVDQDIRQQKGLCCDFCEKSDYWTGIKPASKFSNWTWVAKQNRYHCHILNDQKDKVGYKWSGIPHVTKMHDGSSTMAQIQADTTIPKPVDHQLECAPRKAVPKDTNEEDKILVEPSQKQKSRGEVAHITMGHSRPSRHIWNDVYKQYACYEYNGRTWDFIRWMPRDWSPSPTQDSPRPSQASSMSPSITSQIQAGAAYNSGPPSFRHDTLSNHSSSSSYSAAAGASASPSRDSYNNYAQQLYGPSSSVASSSQASWASPSTPLHGGHRPARSGVQSGQPQPQYNISNASHTLGHGGGSMPKGKGAKVLGTYKPPSNNIHYEMIDSSFYVRNRPFFFEGRVFAVMVNETAGENSNVPTSGRDATDYNSSGSIVKSITASINSVKYKDHLVYTNVRRFIVVRRKHEFCYACPIFTYSGRATTKRGVRPSEHGIAYTWNQTPQLLQGEGGITKPAIPVVMAADVPNLHVASRVYYGIIHPIQYNVKVKEIGYVPKQDIPKLIGNWKSEDDKDTYQDLDVTDNAEIPEEADEEDEEEEEADEEDEEEEEDDEDDDDDPPGGQSSTSYTAHGVNSMTSGFSNMNIHGQQ